MQRGRIIGESAAGMSEHCDILIIGAGTAGTYFGWQMAQRGHSVVIVEKEERLRVGKRLDVFHVDSSKFAEFGIPPPAKDSPEFCVVLEQGISYSPEGKFPKTVKYPFHVMRLPFFLQRLFTLAESAGARLEFSTVFSRLLYEDGRISGAVLKRGDEESTVQARLVVDASGINAVVRTALPPDYGVENFRVAPDEMFFVVLRYVTWLDAHQPRTVNAEGWTFYKTWVAPSFHERGAIIGVGATGSFDNAEKVFKEFAAIITLPPYEVDKIERGITPYRRPPYSVVGDGFLCLGDSACLTKPFSGEGVTSGWTLCKIAVEIVHQALQKGGYLTADALWPINVRYFRGQGAKFAGILATVPSAANATKAETSYLFKKDVIFSEADLTDMNRDFELHLTAGKTVGIFGTIVLGLLTRNYSFASLRALLRSVRISGHLRAHYEHFPENRSEFSSWAAAAEDLWKRANPKMT
jgi:digeranylgeranylglycerophospholipid reductase